MKHGDEVVAIMNWERVGLRKGMKGRIVSCTKGDIRIFWEELKKEYPNGVFHYDHHLNYVFEVKS